MRAVAAPKDLDTDPSSSVKNDAAETSHIEQEQSKKSARLK